MIATSAVPCKVFLHSLAKALRRHCADDPIDWQSIAKKDDRRDARAEDELRLMGCVSKLSDIQQRVVRLRMLEELSGDDVARELGVRPDHVATLLYRAKKELFRCVTGPESEPPAGPIPPTAAGRCEESGPTPRPPARQRSTRRSETAWQAKAGTVQRFCQAMKITPSRLVSAWRSGSHDRCPRSSADRRAS
jgi:Sigma-70, region 4